MSCCAIAPRIHGLGDNEHVSVADVGDELRHVRQILDLEACDGARVEDRERDSCASSAAPLSLGRRPRRPGVLLAAHLPESAGLDAQFE
jgi:hypothetical protein